MNPSIFKNLFVTALISILALGTIAYAKDKENLDSGLIHIDLVRFGSNVDDGAKRDTRGLLDKIATQCNQMTECKADVTNWIDRALPSYSRPDLILYFSCTGSDQAHLAYFSAKRIHQSPAVELGCSPVKKDSVLPQREKLVLKAFTKINNSIEYIPAGCAKGGMALGGGGCWKSSKLEFFENAEKSIELSRVQLNENGAAEQVTLLARVSETDRAQTISKKLFNDFEKELLAKKAAVPALIYKDIESALDQLNYKSQYEGFAPTGSYSVNYGLQPKQ